MIATVNPATGDCVATFDTLTESQLDEKLARAAAAFLTYRRTTFAERAAWMSRAAEILEAEKDAFARIMTLEMGKPLEAARQEAAKCATACRYYVEHAGHLLADELVDTGGPMSFIRYQPIGAVLAVMPWNFPFWQVFRFLAPALMAGNVGLLKHASNVPQCALAIEDIVRRAGFPADVFQTLLIGATMVRGLIEDPRVKAVTLTGSEPAGRQVAGQAGKQIKKCVLELGGSDPFIVMPSADLDAAVRTAVQARVINNGQSCIAAKRFILEETIAGEFERRFVETMSQLVVGDPMQEATQVGPLATPVILHELDEQVKRSVTAGARVLTGGCRVERPGNYYAPTVLADVPENAPAYREELFGPVAVLLRARGIAAAIQIDAGMVFINGMVASDPRLPFGGIKASGYGRELSAWGIREFVNVKTVVVR
jgi:succinate-semialdehyde dehydrogenase/glutarate-semialdehyde dehydrogenase